MMQSLRHLCQQALRSNSQIQIAGRTIRTEKDIAEGGYAYVSLVRDIETEALFALKRLPFADAEGYELAKKELDILTSLPPHDNVVRCHGSSVTSRQGAPWMRGAPGEVLILLDYCRGGTLLDLMQRCANPHEGLQEQVVRRILLHVARGLAHLHAQNPPIVHCDLKVENVLFDPPKDAGALEGPPPSSLGALWSRARGQAATHTPAKKATQPEGLEGVFRVCDFGSCMRGIMNSATGGREEKLRLAEQIERHSTLAYRAPEMVDLYLEYPVGPPADIWEWRFHRSCVVRTVLALDPWGRPNGLQRDPWQQSQQWQQQADAENNLWGFAVPGWEDALESSKPGRNPCAEDTSHTFSSSSGSNRNSISGCVGDGRTGEDVPHQGRCGTVGHVSFTDSFSPPNPPSQPAAPMALAAAAPSADAPIKTPARKSGLGNAVSPLASKGTQQQDLLLTHILLMRQHELQQQGQQLLQKQDTTPPVDCHGLQLRESKPQPLPPEAVDTHLRSRNW
ncbi:tyrosine kinase-like [Cyclospora cayetanensis]|uniref:non-specific serine/threonine protein kinase n=1 Tax=Cyclospora cayetanensis TaxID=88456 RepID=A0A1D3CY78_9EIME|nr:tyrosine kinase-like [Cyclospora cayetanensis]